ncbi:MAG: glycosyltransferase family 4 protein [candidate division KSB1 bacterium]
MRLLFINSIQMFAGGEVWMLRALHALQQRGHEVWLCCRPATELAKRATDAGIPVRRISFRGDFDPICILQLARCMRQNRIEVVLTNMDKELRNGGIAAKLAGVPAVIPRRGIDYPLKNRWRYRFAYNVLATRLLANSQATKLALLKNAPWLEEQRVEVIHNGIDHEAFVQSARRSFRVEWNIPPHAPVLGFVGQLDERKGLGVLLSAFELIQQRLPEARLVLAGEGPLREMIESEIREQGWERSVLLAGFVDDAAAIMQAIDVLLLPSYWEGFGIVILEAMACGRPVITTNISSMPEIVDDGRTGYLIPPGATAALAERAVELLQNKSLRESMGRAGRARVAEHFSHDVMIDRLEKLFHREAHRSG